MPETSDPAGQPGCGHSPERVIPRRSVVGWILYDLANTVFSMGVITLTFPLWIRENVGAAAADWNNGIITAISMAIVFALSPILGMMTDCAPRRMPFLIASTCLCVGLALGFARWGFLETAILFIVSNIAYQAGTQYYDSLLPEVSTEKNRGRIGGLGVGIGYFGSFIAIGLSLFLADQPKSTLFSAYAATFMLFALPCMLFVKERGNPNPRPFGFRAAVAGLQNTIASLRASNQYPGLLRFLLGRVFYTDAINTVITVMALFVINVATTSGLDAKSGERQAQFVMLFAISFAVAGGFAWGWLNDKWGPKRTLDTVLLSWMGIFVLASAIGLLGLPLWVLYIMAASAGFCLAGVWSADRPFMLRLTPPDRIGEFYGLYGMVGRFSAITGPLVWAGMTAALYRLQSKGQPAVDALQEATWSRTAQGGAVLCLLVMMSVGYFILRPVSDQPQTLPRASH